MALVLTILFHMLVHFGLNLTLARTGGGWEDPNPHKVFLSFFIEDKTSVRSSLAQILRQVK